MLHFQDAKSPSARKCKITLAKAKSPTISINLYLTLRTHPAIFLFLVLSFLGWEEGLLDNVTNSIQIPLLGAPSPKRNNTV